MPKIERPAFTTKEVTINKGTAYEAVKIELVGRASVFGKKIRKYFNTVKAAKEHIEKIQETLVSHGKSATKLSDVQRADAVQAFERLKGKGELLTAVDFFLKHGPRIGSVSALQAAEQYLATRGVSSEEFRQRYKRRPKERREKVFGTYNFRHRVTINGNLKHFTKAFKKDSIHSLALRATDVQAYLVKHFKNPRTLQNHRATIHSLFEWCIEQGYCEINPARRWTSQNDRMRRYSRGRKPGILTPSQLGGLLAMAEKHDPEMLPYLLLGAFAGMRPDELQGLAWKNIKKSFINLPAPLTKTNDEKDIPIHSSLAPWLAAISLSSGLVAPKDASRRRLKLWKLSHCSDSTNPSVKELGACPKWPNDGLRHSFGSYRYAEVKSIDQVSTEMRHEDSKVFRKHYLNRGVTDEDAAAYWALRPAKIKLT